MSSLLLGTATLNEEMTMVASISNDPEEFAEDALEGFAQLHNRYVRQVPGGVVRRVPGDTGKVAVLLGGGSGHYPAFAGLVGPGFADGAVVGNVFTSPSAQYGYSVGKAAHRGGGVIFAYGNYAGDVMNFGVASTQLQAEGIDARNVIVTDDILSAPVSEMQRRRGIAGDFNVFKFLSAAAETGANIDEVARIGNLANDRTRTAGIALGGCTMPGADQQLFTVPEGKMAIGLGIHGEPGLKTVDLGTAKEIATYLAQAVLAEAPGDSKRIAVLLNGLGSTKYEELFIVWKDTAKILMSQGYTLVMPEVGELVTSLDMAGLSLTVTWLNDELEPLWTAPARTPAWTRHAQEQGGVEGFVDGAAQQDELSETPQGSAASQGLAAQILLALERALQVIRNAEAQLADLDSIAGDGDHGRGMVRGLSAAYESAKKSVTAGAGAGTVLQAAGDAWGARAGGTSGILWGSALRSAGSVLGDQQLPNYEAISTAAQAFVKSLESLGQARVGDKTMLDAVIPWEHALSETLGEGKDLSEAWETAAQVAQESAQGTAKLAAKRGRARTHQDASIGNPDPGAISFALIVDSLIGELQQ